MNSRLSLIHNTFHISKIKPYVENHWSNLQGRYKEQPVKVMKGRWEVKHVLEFHTTPRTGQIQYLVRSKECGSDDEK